MRTAQDSSLHPSRPRQGPFKHSIGQPDARDGKITTTTATSAAAAVAAIQLPFMAANICFLLTLAGNPADVSACNASPQQQQWHEPEGTLPLTLVGAIAAAVPTDAGPGTADCIS